MGTAAGYLRRWIISASIQTRPMEAAPRVNGIVVSAPTKPNASVIVQRKPPAHATTAGAAFSPETNCSVFCGCHCISCDVIPCFSASCARRATIVSICSSVKPAVRGSLNIAPRIVARSWLALSCAPASDGTAVHTSRRAARRPSVRVVLIERSILFVYVTIAPAPLTAR